MAERREGMPLLTLTRLWLFGRFMYSVGDVKLWTPIPHRALGYGLAVFVPLWVLLGAGGVGFSGAGLTFHFVIPGLLVWWLLRVVAEGQRPSETIGSWARLLWHVIHTRRVRPVRVRERRGRRG